MSLKRITISVPAEIADKAGRAVAAGEVESVSAYFVRLAAREPDWAEARRIVDELIAEAGELRDEDRAWARQALGLEDDGADLDPPARRAPTQRSPARAPQEEGGARRPRPRSRAAEGAEGGSRGRKRARRLG